MFLRALDHYRATESDEAREHLRRPGPAPEVLRDYLLTMAVLPDGRTVAHGCFVVNTATELGIGDPAVDERTQAAFGVTRDGLREVPGRSNSAGCHLGRRARPGPAIVDPPSRHALPGWS